MKNHSVERLLPRGLASVRIWLPVLAVLTATAACRSSSIEGQAERVAKNWSLVMRANQILPIYPLSEDLQPGDVFLVDIPINEQQRIYQKKGFLPLEHQLKRLAPTEDAGGFHAGLFERKMAAFPSYSFRVERGGGLEIGLPIQGIPIALGLLGADQAEVSVTIGNAQTYGLTTFELLSSLRDWAERPLVRAELDFLYQQNRAAHPGDPPSLFLRVVNRVYLTGGVTVTVNRASGLRGDLRGGAWRERDDSSPDGVQETSDRRDEIAALTGALAEALPGGRIRIGVATRSSISLAEEFARPLVVGYLGFDVPLLEQGRLGAPVATSAVLLRGASPAPTLGDLSPDQLQYDLRRIWLERAADGGDPDLDPEAAKGAVVRAARGIGGERFSAVAPQLEQLDPPAAVSRFFDAADRYVTVEGDQGLRYKRVIHSVDAAVQQEKKGDG